MINKITVKVLCAGWQKHQKMYLTEEQLEKWQNNPMVLDIEILNNDDID